MMFEQYYPRRFGMVGHQHWLCQSIQMLYENTHELNVRLFNVTSSTSVDITVFNNNVNTESTIKDSVLTSIIFDLSMDVWHETQHIEQLLKKFSQARINHIFSQLNVNSAQGCLPHGYHINNIFFNTSTLECIIIIDNDEVQYQCTFQMCNNDIISWRMSEINDLCVDPSLPWPAAHDLFLVMLSIAHWIRYVPNIRFLDDISIIDKNLIYLNLNWYNLSRISEINLVLLDKNVIKNLSTYLETISMIINNNNSAQQEEVLWID